MRTFIDHILDKCWYDAVPTLIQHLINVRVRVLHNNCTLLYLAGEVALLYLRYLDDWHILVFWDLSQKCEDCVLLWQSSISPGSIHGTAQWCLLLQELNQCWFNAGPTSQTMNQHLVGSFLFIWIPMLWIYGHYIICLILLVRRSTLDVRNWRL